jgi:CheY-like chemotaxis protein/CHASE3 domain sensor protein
MTFSANTTRFGAMFIGALALIALNTWFINYNFDSLSEHEFWVAHTGEVEADLDQALLVTLESVTAMRGYLLAGERVYLDDYRNASGPLQTIAGHIREMTIDNPVQTRNSDLLDIQLKDFKRYLDEAVEAKSKHSFNVGNIDQFFISGKVKIDSIRAILSKMKEHEEGLMLRRSEQVSQSKKYFHFAVLIAALLNALFIVVAFVFVKRNYDQLAREASTNAYESKVKEEINLLSRGVSGELSAKEVAARTLEFLASHFDFLSSHFYAFEAAGLSKLSSYGVSDNEEMSGSRYSSSSLVNEAAKRTKPWIVKEVPDNYWRIKSGLGEAKPQNLLFLPIRFQDQNFAVLELGSFAKLSDEVLTRAAKLSEIIGIALNAAQSRDRLQELLEKTQQQSEELQLQQEELRSNNEELEQQAHALEEQQMNMTVKNADLEEIRKQLELKATDLENSSKYKSEFLAKMSHELRTPLNSLLILSTLLFENKEQNLNDRQKQFATSIHNSGQDLLMLINDILDLSKIEAKKLRLKIDSLPINSILTSSEASFSIQAKSKGLTFVVAADPTTRGDIIKTDRQRLEQILRNFISNAIKFTDTGTVTLKVSYTADKKKLNFSVIDTGIGIPDDKIELIFEAFEQADGSVSRKYGGTGLGLTISKELAGLLEGSITVKSHPGEGSEFMLTLPISISVNGDSSREEMPYSNQASVVAAVRKRTESVGMTSQYHEEAVKLTKDIDATKNSILIIEDDERFRQSVVEAVRGYGFQAIECSSGELALEILSRVIPSAILLDIKLPEVSGFVLLEVIKSKPELRHIPVHIISGLEYQHNALRMGAMGYLTKPVTMEKISSALERIKGVISGNKRKILLIEDDETQSQAISQIIEGEDLDVITARTGKEAIENVKNGAFDCIILDLKLGDTSGFKLLEEFNQLNASIPPIVIYTGKDITDEEETYLRKFSESIIIKGARSPERLLDEVNLFLHRVESLLPQDKKNILKMLRSNEQTFEGKTVLIVDDDLRNIFSLTSALESKGISVKIAKDGIEALEALDKNKDVDLVLMDIMMPRMDGYEAMKRIRANADSRIRALPVIALTAKAMKGDYEKCIDAGANDYLPKPINLESFTTVLKVWLSRGKV